MKQLDDSLITLFDEEKMSREQYLNLYKTVGAAMEVYNVLHRGLEEAIYQEALELELKQREIPFVSQKALRAWYKGILLQKTYFADIVTFDNIIIELKSVDEINKDHRSQLFNYMRLTNSKCGALVNFGDESFYCERYWFVESLDDFRLLRKDNLDIYVRK